MYEAPHDAADCVVIPDPPYLQIVKVEAIVRWLPLLGVAITSQGAGWVECKCPLAPWRHRTGNDKNPSFGVRIEPGDSQVWCFSCHYGGTQISLLYELSKVGYEFDFAQALKVISLEGPGEMEDFDFSYEQLRNVQDVEPFPEWYLDNFEPAYVQVNIGPDEMRGEVHPYLEIEREVTYDFAEKWDLRYDPYRHRVCFPIRDYKGRLTGVHGRTITDDEPRYLVYTHESRSNSNVWLGEHLVDRNEPVVFVESVFDLARVWEVYENVMSPLRSGINAAQLSRVRWAREVICFFDNDEAGHHAVERVKDGFRKEAVWSNVHAVWPPLEKDPGELEVREIAGLLDEYLGKGD